MIHDSGLVGARYTMLAEFLHQIATRDPDSGQVTRRWTEPDDPEALTVRNLTKGILGGGIRVVGSTETWGDDYEDIEWAKMNIEDQLIDSDGDGETFITRRFRVTNIRDQRTGKQLWVGDDGLPIVFNVMGITPIMDPFGRPVEYELLLKGETGD